MAATAPGPGEILIAQAAAKNVSQCEKSMVCCFKKISGPCQGPLGVFGDLSLARLPPLFRCRAQCATGSVNAKRLCALQGRDTRFNRRMCAEQLADATGDAKGGDALGQFAWCHAA